MGEATPSGLGSEQATASDFVQASERLVRLAVRLLGGHHARLYRFDPEPVAPRLVAFAGRTGVRATTGSVDAELAFARLAARVGAARAAPDILAEPGCPLDAANRKVIRSQRLGGLAAAPIVGRDDTAGALVLADHTGRRYTEDELTLLTTVADNAGLVLESERLHAEIARERQEATELALVASLIGEDLDSGAVGQRIAESVLGLLSVHSSAIRLLQPDGDLGAIALGGRAKQYAGRGEVVPAGAGIVGRAATEGRPVWTGDIRIDPNFESHPTLRARNVSVGIVAGLAVPMRAAGTVIGVLSVGSGEPRNFSRAEIDLLQRFADQAALAISNARSRDVLVRQAARLKILHDIDLAILSETAPVAIAEAVLARLRDLLEVPRAIVNLFDWTTGEVEWLAAVGRHRIHRGGKVRYSLALAGDLEGLRRGEPQVVDVRTLPPSPEVDALLASGVHVYMVVPMITAGELIGSVSFGGDQARFPEEQVRIAREVAAQLAVALHQARLVERLRTSYAELEQAQAQLAQSQKMEAVGQLAGGIAHDFNNLLTVIGGRSSLLQMRLPADDPARRDIDLIQTTAQRAAGLTRQLLAFSRKQVLEARPIDLRTLVDGVTPILRRLIGEHIEIVILSEADTGKVMADPGQMEQVVVNLVVNARDAMAEGGTLTIATAGRTVEEPGLRAQDRVVPAGRYVTLSIRDTGSGMDAATAARVFEPFFTTKEPGKGTGLGLSTVHGIVHQSGGYLALESALGRGTTFTIYLPRIPDAAEVAAARAEPDPNLVRGTGTILLVEDDDELRRLAAEVLAAAGYTILEAGDPLEALTLCDRRDGPIDLLLTDMVMPAMRGPELAAQLWESRPGVKVLIMSGYTESSDADQPRWSFLQKPFTPQGLTHAVRAALAAPAYPPRA